MRRPIIIQPQTIMKYHMTNHQLGALIRLQSIVHMDQNGVLPPDPDILKLSEWDGPQDEFQAIERCVVPHPDHPGRVTVWQALECFENHRKGVQARKERLENLVTSTRQEAEAKIRKEVQIKAHQARLAQNAEQKEVPVKKVCIARYSF